MKNVNSAKTELNYFVLSSMFAVGITKIWNKNKTKYFEAYTLNYVIFIPFVIAKKNRVSFNGEGTSAVFRAKW